VKGQALRPVSWEEVDSQGTYRNPTYAYDDNPSTFAYIEAYADNGGITIDESLSYTWTLPVTATTSRLYYAWRFERTNVVGREDIYFWNWTESNWDEKVILSENTSLTTGTLGITSGYINSTGGFKALFKSKATEVFGIPGNSTIYLYDIYVDLNPPTYSGNSTDSTEAGSPVEFRLRWSDDLELSGFIFSLDNGDGSFVNDSWRPFYRPMSYEPRPANIEAEVLNPALAFDDGLYDTISWATLRVWGTASFSSLFFNFTNALVNSKLYYTWEGSGCDFAGLIMYDYSSGSWDFIDQSFPSSFETESFTIVEDYVQDGLVEAYFTCVGLVANLDISDVFVSDESSPDETQAWSNVIKVINSTVGASIRWKVYANDRSGNWKASEEFSFITTPDRTPPQYSDASINSTITGQPVEFRLKWTDYLGVDGYIFSFDNGDGSFVNDSWEAFYLRPSNYSSSSSGDAEVLNPTQAFDNDLYDTSTWARLTASGLASSQLTFYFNNAPVNSEFYYTWRESGCTDERVSVYDYSAGGWVEKGSSPPSYFSLRSFTIVDDYVQDGLVQTRFECINALSQPYSGTLDISDVFVTGATLAWSNVTKVINSTVGASIRWKVYANDRSGNWNASEEFSFIAIDPNPPQYFDSSTNSTLAGEPVEFRLRWTDETDLDTYIFSLDNCTNSFKNVTEENFAIGGTEDWSNVTHVINNTIGCPIRWKVYANDRSGNWNASEEFSFISVEELAPQWSNLRHEPTSVTESDSVDIKVTWFDYEDLDTVIIYENSTGTWTENVCSLVDGTCSGEIVSYSIILFFGITSALVSLIIIKRRKTVKLSGKFKIVLIFIPVILVIFLISILLFPEVSRNFSRMLMRLGIIPMAFPPTEFTHNIPAENLELGEVVGYYSYARDILGNENWTENRTFTVQEITSYLMAHWKFDEGSGSIAYDSSDYDNNGTLGNGTCSSGSECPDWETSDCHSGSCLSFDGVDDFVNVSNSPSLAFDYDTFTILVWAKTSDDQKAFFDKGEWVIFVGVWDEVGNFYMWDNDNNDIDMYGTTNVSDGEWHHIAAVRDKPNDIVRLYVDGVEEANDTDIITENIDTMGDIYIGYDMYDYLNGTVDEVKVYNIALTPEQIMNEYLYGIPVTTSTTTTTPTGDGGDGGDGGGGDGGGGGVTGKTYVVTDEQLAGGYTKELSVGDKFKFTLEEETHYVAVDNVTSTTVRINVTSETQQTTLSIGGEKYFELTGDNYYDLSVKVNDVNATTLKADIAIKKIYEEILAVTTTTLPTITTTVPTCVPTGEACSSNSDCCSGYCYPFKNQTRVPDFKGSS